MPYRSFGAARVTARALWLLCLCILLTMPDAAAAQPAALIERAREAAQSDRNSESARLFALHLQQYPEQRREILREYADQLIYAGAPERALPLLREVLGWSTRDEERRQAQQSYALALLWSDQHRQAIRTYDAILAADPGNEEALFNRVRALQWLDRPDRAAAALDALPQTLREGGRAQEIRRELQRNARPTTRVTGHYVDQADGLQIRGFRLDQQLFALGGAAQVQPYFEHRRFDQDRDGGISSYGPGIIVAHRPADWLEVRGLVGVEFQRGSGVERTEPVYEASIAVLPSDRLRFDLVTARRTLDNLRSLQLGITSTHYFASADYWPDPMWKLTARGELTDYSDGNERRWVQVQVERRVSRDPHIFIGARATAFRFEDRLDHGYFNPDSLRSLELTARGWSKIGRATWVELASSFGPEKSSPGTTKLAYWLRGKLTHQLTHRLEASLVAERLSSQGVANSGFARNTVSLSLGLRW